MHPCDACKRHPENWQRWLILYSKDNVDAVFEKPFGSLIAFRMSSTSHSALLKLAIGTGKFYKALDSCVILAKILVPQY